MNAYDPIYFWARVAPQRPALTFPGGMISYSQLCNAADAAAVAIQRSGFAAKRLVNIDVVNPAFQTILLLALGRIGIPVSMLSPTALKTHEKLKPAGIIADNPKAIPAGGRNLVVDHNWFVSKLANANPPRPEPIHLGADDVLRIVTTSGTTGQSRALAITHGMFEDRLRSCPLMPDSRRTLNMMTPQGSWGYLSTMKILRAGGTYCFAPFPADCLDLCDTFQVEIICASVAQAATLIEDQKQRPRELASVRQLFVGGSSVAPGLVEDLRRFVCRDVVIGYGASETGQIASASVSTIGHIPGAVGYLHPGVKVEIVDDAKRAVQAGVSGTVRISFSGGTKEYISGADETSDSVFQDGWFYPGDMGSLTREGLLIIDGRTSELVLNKGGFKIGPSKIEDMLKQEDGVQDAGVVAATSEAGAPEIWAAIVPSGTFAADKLMKQFEARLGALTPDRIFPVDTLPRNDIGKIQYNFLKERLLAMATQR